MAKRTSREERRQRMKEARAIAAKAFGQKPPSPGAPLVEEKPKEPKFEEDKTRVPRIYFGKVISPKQSQDHSHHILELGKKPARERGGLRLVGAAKEGQGDAVHEQLRKIWADFKRHDLELEDGPYADKDGMMADLTQELCGGIKGCSYEAIDRVIDGIRPFLGSESESMMPREFDQSKYNFHVDFNLTTHDDNLPTAGGIMCDEERVKHNPSIGTNMFMLTHSMEPYLLAISVLRRVGCPAYLATGVLEDGEGGEENRPLIVFADINKDPPLTSFPLLRYHSPMGSMELFSDAAVKGVTHAMRAFQRSKHLGAELVRQLIFGRPMEEEDIANQIKRISKDLVKAHKGYGRKNTFVMVDLQVLHQEVFNAETWNGLRISLSEMNTGERGLDPFLASKGIEQVAPMIPFNPEHLDMLLSADGNNLFYLYPGLALSLSQIWRIAEERANNCVAAAQIYMTSKLGPIG